MVKVSLLFPSLPLFVLFVIFVVKKNPNGDEGSGLACKHAGTVGKRGDSSYRLVAFGCS
jgi:hypothetical protein